MNLNIKYWFFKSALPEILCDKIIKYGESKKEIFAVTGNIEKRTKENVDEVMKYRNSNVSWISEKWLYRYIHFYTHVANENAKWNFDLKQTEPCQFTKYKLNQYYHWHCDSLSTPCEDPKKPYLKGMIRKLSLVCSLSDPKDYTGGRFQFKLTDEKTGENYDFEVEEILPRGSIIVFPSFLYHRVKPVKQGTRYSLVAWSNGFPYK